MSIELEDTLHADGSLEMAGDKLRVSQALQWARLPFTLRKVSTNMNTPEEIGVLRFDASRYPGWTVTLVAEMDVSLAGQLATLELRSLLDASLITTLTTSALVTTKRSAVVVLPASEVLYSVRLSRTGGTEDDLVSCRAVELEVQGG